MHFLNLLVGMLSGMLGLENSNPGRKIAVYSVGSTCFCFEKGVGPNAPSFPPRIVDVLED